MMCIGLNRKNKKDKKERKKEGKKEIYLINDKLNRCFYFIGGTTPNHMIARSEFVVHRGIYKE